MAGRSFFFWGNMVKLTQLLFELSAAAAEADRLGLKSMSFGRYGKDGKVTHIVKGDKLEPVKGDEKAPAEKPAAQNPEMKPTGTSAKAAGKTQPKQPTAQDTQQVAGATDAAPETDTEKEFNKIDKEHELSSQAEEPEHVATANPYATKIKEFGKKMSHADVGRYVPESFDPYGFSKEIVVGEDVYVCPFGGLDKFLFADESLNGLPDWKEKVAEMDKQAVLTQHKEWRAALDDDIQLELIHAQLFWQELPQYGRHDATKARVNALINNVCKGPPPASLQLTHPIERGMQLKSGDLEEFMKAIHIGEEMDLPPSGFTTSPVQARTFGEPGYGQAGVIMRLAPNRDGIVHGLALSDYIPSPDLVAKDQDPDELAMAWRNGVLGYNEEKEVIRPSGPKVRVTNVRKVMEQPNPNSNKPARCLYIIDMEELGYPVDAETMTEDVTTDMPENKVFMDLMNSPFRQTNIDETSLSGILGSLKGAIE